MRLTTSRCAHSQSERGKLARSGTPCAKSAFSLGPFGGGAGAGAASAVFVPTAATRVAEPPRAFR
jgi:hypothetical protein